MPSILLWQLQGLHILAFPCFPDLSSHRKVSFCPSYSNISSAHILPCMTLALRLWLGGDLWTQWEVWGWEVANRWYSLQNSGCCLYCWTMGSISLAQEVFIFCLSLAFISALVSIICKLLLFGAGGCFKLSFAGRLTDCLESKLKVAPSLYSIRNFLCNTFPYLLAWLSGHLMHNTVWITLSSVAIILTTAVWTIT